MTASQHTLPPADVTKLLRDHQWHPVDPANPGSPAITALWGDPASGPSGALLRVFFSGFPGGDTLAMSR